MTKIIYGIAILISIALIVKYDWYRAPRMPGLPWFWPDYIVAALAILIPLGIAAGINALVKKFGRAA